MNPLKTLQLIIASLLLFIGGSAFTEPRAPLQGINSSSRFLLYYGDDFSAENMQKMKTFDVVVLHPNSAGVTPKVVKELQDAGVAYVLGYISIGEDTPQEDELPITHLGKGPIYIDEETQQKVYQNTGIASFYMDSVYNPELTNYDHDSVADTNGIFGGYYIYPNSDWRWVINEMRIGGSPLFSQRKYAAGLKQIAGERDAGQLESKLANFGFDGFFLDTIDTAGPYSGIGWYPWAVEEMQKTVKFISDTYPDKVIVANRGAYYYQAGLHNSIYDIKPVDYSIRPYINAMLFESYMLDSDPSHQGKSPYFLDNHINIAPKLISEANRPDGFTILSLDYMMDRSPDLYDELFTTVVKQNGWLSYLTLRGKINTVDLDYLAKLDNASLMKDTQPPEWMHTGKYANQSTPARVGVQKVIPGENSNEMIVFWDSAKDQSLPVKYNISIASKADFSDQIKFSHVKFEKNPAWDDDPANHVANQYTLQNLPKKNYFVRVTAEDSSPDQNEDQNTVTLSLNLDISISNPLDGTINLDAQLDEWQNLQSFGADAKDSTNSQSVDWKEIWMAHDENQVYLAYEYHNPVQMSWGHITYFDTDTNNATGFKGWDNSMPVGVEYMIQAYNLWKYTGNGTSWEWQFIKKVSHSTSQFTSEMSFPRSLIENPEKVDIYFEAYNPAIGLTDIDLLPDNAITDNNTLRYSFSAKSNLPQ